MPSERRLTDGSPHVSIACMRTTRTLDKSLVRQAPRDTGERTSARSISVLRRLSRAGISAYLMKLSICFLVVAVQSVVASHSRNNALWTSSIFLRGYSPSANEQLTPEYLRRYSETLRRNHIKYPYLFSGPYEIDGHLPGFAFSDTARNSIDSIMNHNPDLVILPWVGGVQNKTVHLEDPAWVRTAIADSTRLVKRLEVRGLHVDFEYFVPGGPLDAEILGNQTVEGSNDHGKNVNEFLRLLRLALPDAFISSVVTATSSGTKPWKRKTSLQELKAMVRYVDQVSFMYYDTAIGNQREFEDNCVELLKDIRTLKQSCGQREVQFLIGIGTFVNKEEELQKYRNIQIENVTNTLETIKRSMATLDDDEELIDGIAIYCDWATDESQWTEFRDRWPS